MRNSPESRSCPWPPRPQFLLREGNLLLAPPSSGSPTPVAKIPSTLVTWMMLASDEFFEEYKRHLAFVILYHPEILQWRHELPRQTCRADGVSWRLAREDLPAVEEGFFLVGSFQSHPPAESPLAAVPALPGLHLIYHPTTDLPLIAFFRHQQPARIDQVDPDHMIAPDHECLLKCCASRLHLL